MISKDARIENIDFNIKEGLYLLQQAATHFRKAHKEGSGMGELLLKRTVFSMFIYKVDCKKNGKHISAGDFIRECLK